MIFCFANLQLLCLAWHGTRFACLSMKCHSKQCFKQPVLRGLVELSPCWSSLRLCSADPLTLMSHGALQLITAVKLGLKGGAISAPGSRWCLGPGQPGCKY
jgi:hypothetical protein